MLFDVNYEPPCLHDRMPDDARAIVFEAEEWALRWADIQAAQRRIAADTHSQPARDLLAECDDDPDPTPPRVKGPSWQFEGRVLRGAIGSAPPGGQPAVALPVPNWNAVAAPILRPRLTYQEPIEAFDPSTLQGQRIEPREWIVKDWLPVGSVTICYADGGMGKSLLAQQLMTACAIGGSWCGIDVMPCRSVGFFCEDDLQELHYRQSRINPALGATFADLSETRWISGVGADNLLITFDRSGAGTTTNRLEEIRRLAITFRARLLIVDTAADTFGGNEIIRSEVRQFVGRALTRLAQDINGAVLLNAHPSRSGLAPGGDLDGGSTAWNNSARSRWGLARPAESDGLDPDARVLTRRKANYAAAGASIPLRWTEGVLMPTAGAAGLPPQDRREAAEAVFLALLARCDAGNMPLSMSPSAGNYAPKVFAKRPDRQGMTKRDFDIAMNALFGAGLIRLATYGRKGDEHRRIAIADPDDTEAEVDA